MGFADFDATRTEFPLAIANIYVTGENYSNPASVGNPRKRWYCKGWDVLRIQIGDDG